MITNSETNKQTSINTDLIFIEHIESVVRKEQKYFNLNK